MRERRQIMQLATQLQQLGPFQASTLATFIADNELSPEEVAMLQGEVISNLVSIFSVQQATNGLLQRLAARPPSPAVPAPQRRVPTLADLTPQLRDQALLEGRVFLPGASEALHPVMLKDDSFGLTQNAFRTGDSMTSTDYAYDRLYAFPYDPMAAGRVQAGRVVRYYYPGEGLDLTGVEQIAYIDELTGVLQLSNGKLIPAAYVTGLVGKNE